MQRSCPPQSRRSCPLPRSPLRGTPQGLRAAPLRPTIRGPAANHHAGERSQTRSCGSEDSASGPRHGGCNRRPAAARSATVGLRKASRPTFAPRPRPVPASGHAGTAPPLPPLRGVGGPLGPWRFLAAASPPTGLRHRLALPRPPQRTASVRPCIAAGCSCRLLGPPPLPMI